MQQRITISVTDDEKDEIFRMIILYSFLKGTTRKQVFQEILEKLNAKELLETEIRKMLGSSDSLIKALKLPQEQEEQEKQEDIQKTQQNTQRNIQPQQESQQPQPQQPPPQSPQQPAVADTKEMNNEGNVAKTEEKQLDESRLLEILSEREKKYL